MDVDVIDRVEIHTNAEELDMVMEYMDRFYEAQVMYGDSGFDYNGVTWDVVVQNKERQLVSNDIVNITVDKVEEESKKVTMTVRYYIKAE